jgi:short-subunit dehydrogenase
MKKRNLIIFGASSDLAKALVSVLDPSVYNKIFLVYRDIAKIENFIHGEAFIPTTDGQLLQKIEVFSNSENEYEIVFFNGKVFFKKFTETTDLEIDEVFNSNLLYIVKILQQLLASNIQITKILTLGSRAGMYFSHHKFFSFYSASKLAIVGLFRSLAAEYPKISFTYYLCPSADTDIFNKGIVDRTLLVDTKKNEVQKKRKPEEIGKEILNILDRSEEVYDVIYESKN